MRGGGRGGVKWLARKGVRQLGWFCLLGSSVPGLTFLIAVSIARASCNSKTEEGVTQCIVLGINLNKPLEILLYSITTTGPAVLLAPVGVLLILASWLSARLVRG